MALRLTEDQARKMGLTSVISEGVTLKPNGMSKRSAAARKEDAPQAILQRACIKKWGERCVVEMKGAIPDRRFRLDVAFPEEKLCVEMDGWEWHGKHKNDFHKDRERQNLLTMNGWKILRFTALQVRRDIYTIIEDIEKVLNSK